MCAGVFSSSLLVEIWFSVRITFYLLFLCINFQWLHSPCNISLLIFITVYNWMWMDTFWSYLLLPEKEWVSVRKRVNLWVRPELDSSADTSCGPSRTSGSLSVRRDSVSQHWHYWHFGYDDLSSIPGLNLLDTIAYLYLWQPEMFTDTAQSPLWGKVVLGWGSLSWGT